MNQEIADEFNDFDVHPVAADQTEYMIEYESERQEEP